ncbi:MAG: hypothetical protein LBV31_04000 [Prevotellaceae bacterium]|jgi:hypothetical protein|nr:hypothetical protein [Prevotellaceae bacterium]
MEEYLPLIITMAIVLVKFCMPSKKSAERTTERRPAIPGFPDFFPELNTEDDEEQTAAPIIEPLSTIPVVEGGRITDSDQKLVALRKTAQNDKVPEQIPEKPDIMIDFELRKAIIYSEILRPKYLE